MIKRFMREGFDKDDGYMMVEDELYEVAQMFTRHLHHAEYVRRRKQVKQQNAAAVNNLPRPTDGRTTMPRETTLKKKSEQLAREQQKALDETSRSRPPVDSSDEGGIAADDEEEDREDDPWVGTSLHSFMTSPRQSRSLVGLEGLRSNTRAAAGYRPESSGSVRSRGQEKSNRQQEPVVVATSGEETATDDDLDVAVAGTSVSTLPKQPDVKVRQAITAERPVPAQRKASPELEHGCVQENGPSTKPSYKTTTIKSRKRMLLDELDDYLDAPERKKLVDNVQDQPRSPTEGSESSTNKGRKEERTAKKDFRFEDVPTFVI